jgi:DNA-binding transcriptional LysR family regulator
VQYLICAAPSFLACHGRPERPKDLARFNCLVQTTQQGAEDWRIRDGEREIHVHVRGNFRTNDGVVLREAVLDGLGIGRLPEYAVSEDIRDGRLVVLFRDVVSWGRTITLAFPRPRHGTARMRLLLDFLERYIKERLAVRS